MISREFKLYLNAGVGVAPVINANQFDQDEEWIFTLLQSDGTVYTPSTGAIIGLKQDGTTILNAGTVNEDGQVVITETEQMTAVPGSNLFEILIDGNTHGTANFVVFVERRPGDIDNPSESDISLFQEAIEAAGNIEQFQADISALQSGLSNTNANLTAETSARASADATLQSNISTEASTRQTQDAVLQAEIDQIIAPTGEAPSAAEVQNARIGVDGTTYDTLGNAIRGQVGDLKNALNNQQKASLLPIRNMQTASGNLTSNSTKWSGVGSASYRHVVIPIKSGQTITVQNLVGGTVIGFLRTYTPPTSNDDDIDYSTETGFTTKINILTTKRSYTVPSDANYLCVMMVINTDTTVVPTTLTIDNYDYLSNYQGFMIDEKINAEIPAVFADLMNHNLTVSLVWESKIFAASVGGNINATAYDEPKRKCTDTIVLDTNCVIKADDNYNLRVTVGDSQYKIVSVGAYKRGDAIFVKKDTPFRLAISDKDNTTDISARTSDEINQHITLLKLEDNNVKWVAMGDSITEGWYSYLDNGSDASNVTPSLGWATKVGELNNWLLTNIAIGGTGFLKTNNAGQQSSTGWYLARHTDFTPYNLVTIGYGINDWKADEIIGSLSDDGSAETPSTVIQAMKATIEAIMTSNPKCKIIGILPLNCAGYNKNYGTKATNWGLGYAFTNSGTLEQFTQALISVYDYYGIQYIDMTHYSCVNRENLLSALLDGVHPSIDFHKLLGHELSGKITF